MLSLLITLLACQQEEPKTLPVDTAPITYYQPPVNSWPICSEEIPADLNGTSFELNETIPNLLGIDQFDDMVSLYQFYGCIVILNISAMWNAPSQALADDISDIAIKYKNNKVIVLTVLPQDLEGNKTNSDDISTWIEAYEIYQPVISDNKEWYKNLVTTNNFPYILLIGPEMTILETEISPSQPDIIAVVDHYLSLN